MPGRDYWGFVSAVAIDTSAYAGKNVRVSEITTSGGLDFSLRINGTPYPTRSRDGVLCVADLLRDHPELSDTSTDVNISHLRTLDICFAHPADHVPIIHFLGVDP